MKLSKMALGATVFAGSGIAFAHAESRGSSGSPQATTTQPTGSRRERTTAGSGSALGLAAKTTGLLIQKGAVFAPADGRETRAVWTDVEVDGASGDEIVGYVDVTDGEEQRTAQIG